MKVITFDSGAYKSLVRKVDRIYEFVKECGQKANEPEPDPSLVWMGNEEAAEMLQISTRTLQRMRTAGEITYSIKGGKVQYTLSEVRRMISGKVFRSKKDTGDNLFPSHGWAPINRQSE